MNEIFTSFLQRLIATEVEPLRSIYQPPPSEPGFSLLVFVLTKLAYLSILSIPEMVYIASGTGHVKHG